MQKTHPKIQLILIPAYFVCVVAIAVMLGWKLHSPSIVQILPSFAPMQFNTALCFFLSSLAIVFITKYSKASSMLSVATLLISFITILQYMTGLNFHIDELFNQHFLTTKTSHIGRMSPNTGLCFLLISIAVIVFNLRKYKQNYESNISLTTLIITTGVAALSLISLLGYIGSIPTAYGWGNLTRMALHTAACFFLISSSLFLLIKTDIKSNIERSVFYKTFAVYVISFAIFGSLWTMQVIDNEKSIKAEIKLDGHLISSRFTLLMEQKVASIERLFARINNHAYSNQGKIRDDLKNYMNMLEPLYLISTQSNNSIQVAKPFLSKKQTAVLIKNCQKALSDDKYIEKNLQISSYENNLCIRDNNLKNIAVLNIPILLNQTLGPDILKNFTFKIGQANETAYNSGEHTKGVFDTNNFIFGVPSLGQQWTIEIIPSESFLASTVTWSPTMFLLLGIFVSALLAILTHTIIISHNKTVALNQANKQLVKQANNIHMIHATTNALSASENLENATLDCVRIICEAMNWPAGHVYFKKGDILAPSNLWYTSGNHDFTALKAVTAKSVFKQGEGLPGRIWANQAPGYIPDVNKDDNFPRAKLCDDIGVVTATGFPLISNNDVYAVLEFFHYEKFSEDADFIKVLSVLSEQLNQVVARKIASQKLKQYSEELQRSNEELDDFAYIASHDLKEPLRGISNLVNFLYEDNAACLGDEGKKNVDVILNLCKRMGSLISGLLEYSRAGRLDLSVQKCDINEIVHNKITLLNSFLNENNATIKVDEKLPTLMCDHVRIGEIFQNLITNGVKYNDKDNKVIEIKANNHEKFVTFSVKDNGIGIDESNTKNIFKIFKRLHGKDEYGGGTGAGLTIARKIIEKHNGEIWVESVPNESTTFYFTISNELNHTGQPNEGPT